MSVARARLSTLPAKDLSFQFPVNGRLIDWARWLINWPRWLSDWAVYLWDLLLGGHGPVGWSGIAAAVHDYGWLVASKLLLPLSRSPGPFERRCFARALRCEPPRYALTVRHIDTAMVDGDTMLRGTLWLPKAAGPFPVVVVRSPYCLHTETEWGHITIAERGYAVLLQVRACSLCKPTAPSASSASSASSTPLALHALVARRHPLRFGAPPCAGHARAAHLPGRVRSFRARARRRRGERGVGAAAAVVRWPSGGLRPVVPRPHHLGLRGRLRRRRAAGGHPRHRAVARLPRALPGQRGRGCAQWRRNGGRRGGGRRDGGRGGGRRLLARALRPVALPRLYAAAAGADALAPRAVPHALPRLEGAAARTGVPRRAARADGRAAPRQQGAPPPRPARPTLRLLLAQRAPPCASRPARVAQRVSPSRPQLQPQA